MSVDLLVETLNRQDEILKELWELVVKQRDIMKTGKVTDLQAIMSEMRHVSVRCQAIEAKRSRAAEELSILLECKPVVSDIIAKLNEPEAEVLREAGHRVSNTVEKLKMEMQILPKLIEEAKILNEMLISEWRRLGEMPGSVGGGGFDTRI